METFYRDEDQSTDSLKWKKKMATRLIKDVRAQKFPRTGFFKTLTAGRK